ncbi:E3 ubiquitin-protein ligase ZNRF2-like isoform X1 [Limulus polyphemus]|uniref:RING-type E3 ubiquitin transferase n=1 Tax=Limulus polyphemus TaxID=6850 RepID=A0ABM1SMG6_LIMPO|nr:E3 ubiquitin-protein ligase ZNRF2-like isoform X1 [Limulus polyphemus]
MAFIHLLKGKTHVFGISHSFSYEGIKCPMCSRFVIPEDVEYHLVMCLTKPRINYNEDVLSEDKGECVICFEELEQGDTIARLPCLCIYHKVFHVTWGLKKQLISSCFKLSLFLCCS